MTPQVVNLWRHGFEGFPMFYFTDLGNFTDEYREDPEESTALREEQRIFAMYADAVVDYINGAPSPSWLYQIEGSMSIQEHRNWRVFFFNTISSRISQNLPVHLRLMDPLARAIRNFNFLLDEVPGGIAVDQREFYQHGL